jgi:hypothetical protein
MFVDRMPVPATPGPASDSQSATVTTTQTESPGKMKRRAAQHFMKLSTEFLFESQVLAVLDCFQANASAADMYLSIVEDGSKSLRRGWLLQCAAEMEGLGEELD